MDFKHMGKMEIKEIREKKEIMQYLQPNTTLQGGKYKNRASAGARGLRHHVFGGTSFV